jgi:hypothetical protein
VADISPLEGAGGQSGGVVVVRGVDSSAGGGGKEERGEWEGAVGQRGGPGLSEWRMV